MSVQYNICTPRSRLKIIISMQIKSLKIQSYTSLRIKAPAVLHGSVLKPTKAPLQMFPMCRTGISISQLPPDSGDSGVAQKVTDTDAV